MAIKATKAKSIKIKTFQQLLQYIFCFAQNFVGWTMLKLQADLYFPSSDQETNFWDKFLLSKMLVKSKISINRF